MSTDSRSLSGFSQPNIVLPFDISGVAPIELPAKVCAGDSSDAKQRYQEITETFTLEYMGKLPRALLLELVMIFLAKTGLSASSYKVLNASIKNFCQFAHANFNSLCSLDHLGVNDTADFLSFLKSKYKGKKAWSALYNAFVSSAMIVKPDIYWPKSWSGKQSESTPGHTPHAYRQMVLALREEVTRIRGKIGKYDQAVKKGNIITHELLNSFSLHNKTVLTSLQIAQLVTEYKNAERSPNGVRLKMGELARIAQKFGVAKTTVMAYAKSIDECKILVGSEDVTITITKDDILATLAHYLPKWPVGGRRYKRGNNGAWQVYQKESEILLSEFDSEQDANDYASNQECDTVVSHWIKGGSLTHYNPAQRILFAMGLNVSPLSKYFKKLGWTTNGIIEEYYPTTYDISCIVLYWHCITGWNKETVTSVTFNSLDLNGFKKDPIKLLNKKLISIKGISEESKKNRCRSIGGEKYRSQPKDKPKIYRHVSDTDDEFGLYRVLHDYYKLTYMFRRYLKGDENKCILIGISPQNTGVFVYGNSFSCLSLFSGSKEGTVDEFFNRHEIYENINESNRVLTTYPRKLRATYSDMLEYLGVHAWIRKMYLGHETIDTTVTSYGADVVGRGIRIERLRNLLNELEEKAFKGKLIHYEQAPKSKNRNIIDLRVWDHAGKDVLICRNKFEPTWAGHIKYIGKGSACDDFGMCLFCEQCVVTEESLPYLLRWRREIKEWCNAKGLGDFSLRLEQRRQAIEEVLDICRQDSGTWADALIKAEIIEMRDDFSAPPFWTGV